MYQKVEVCIERNSGVVQENILGIIPKFVIIPEIFKDVKCNIDNIDYSFYYEGSLFKVILGSNEEKGIDLKKKFWNLYDFLGIILGYYPKILSTDFSSVERLSEIVEKYKTKKCFIRSAEQYIQQLDEETFKNSYIKFIELKNKINFQFSIYNVSMMESNYYSEIAIVNLLQSFDGIFDNLSLTENAIDIIDDKAKEKLRKKIHISKELIQETIKTSEKYKYSSEEVIEKKIELLKNNIHNSTIRINKLDYPEKLKYLFDCTLTNVFEFEEKLDNDKKYNIDNLIILFKNTRNKFSHASSETSKTLTGDESSIYIYKLIILFRLIIFKEIGLDESIDTIKLNDSINNINEYIKSTLINI